MKVFNLPFLSVTVASFFAAAPLLAAPTDFGSGVTVVRSGVISLQPDQAWHFAEFLKSRSYFGAFYVNDTVDQAFYVQGFSNLGLARQSALKGCQILSKGQGKCRAYGEMLPKGMSFARAEAAGLGAGVREAFIGDYQSRQKSDGFGAFAMSSASQYGVSFGWENEAEARATAISYCEAEVAKVLASLNIEGRAWVTSKGLTECRVVDVARPQE